MIEIVQAKDLGRQVILDNEVFSGNPSVFTLFQCDADTVIGEIQIFIRRLYYETVGGERDDASYCPVVIVPDDLLVFGGKVSE